MKEEIKKLWCAALRSGEYKQGTGCLRTRNDEFCCLGVLDDVYAKQTGEDIWELREDGRWYFHDNADILSPKVQDWAELGNGNPNVVDPDDSDVELSLAEFNDDEVPFTTIADMIEKQL